jgi:hypothetical protein
MTYTRVEDNQTKEACGRTEKKIKQEIKRNVVVAGEEGGYGGLGLFRLTAKCQIGVSVGGCIDYQMIRHCKKRERKTEVFFLVEG